MKKLIFSFLITLVLALLFVPIPGYTQNYVQSFEKGNIDWSNGVAEAFGIGSPPAKPINKAQARAIAKREAVSAARQNLIEIIEGVQIDSRTHIKDFIEKSDLFRKEVMDYLRDSKVVDIFYHSDGSVKATVAVMLTGSFAELLLPKTICTIKPIHQQKAANKKGDEAFTGLVVDCRGFRVEPAMVLRIVDEHGSEVYGSVYASRPYAVQMGMAGYTKDLVDTEKNLRVADKPLTVKGIRTFKTGRSDIVISEADAAKIRGSASNLSFLQKCRVIIVLD